MAQSFDLEYYITQAGVCPFEEWLDSLPKVDKAIIMRRLSRVASGNFGDAKHIEQGIQELRIHHGQAFRVYFTVIEQAIVIILAGGTKSTQARDIKKALKYTQDL